ncbi:MAG: DMT family transporter [Anaerolineae bacterium]
MTKDLSRRQAVVFLVLTGILWSTSGLAIKVIDWQPLSILAGRSVLAVGVFLVHLRGRWSRPTPLHLLGAAAFLGTQFFFITSTKMTTAANAIFLQYTGPVYVMLLGAWWLGERPERADWIALGLILLGMGFFFGEKLSFDGLVGNVLALLSGVTMAVMTVALRRIGTREGGDDAHNAPAETILLAYAAGALIGFPSVARETFTLQSVGIIIFLGLIQIGLAFVLYTSAVPHVSALEASLIVTLEPILNPIWVFLVIGEAPGPLALLGAALVIGGVTLRALASAGVGPRRALNPTTQA